MNIHETNEIAQAINAINARTHDAVDELLLVAARYATAIIGGAALGLYLIAEFWGLA